MATFARLAAFALERLLLLVLEAREEEDFVLRVFLDLRVGGISALNGYGSFDVRMRLVVADFEIFECILEYRRRTTLDVQCR